MRFLAISTEFSLAIPSFQLMEGRDVGSCLGLEEGLSSRVAPNPAQMVLTSDKVEMVVEMVIVVVMVVVVVVVVAHGVHLPSVPLAFL